MFAISKILRILNFFLILLSTNVFHLLLAASVPACDKSRQVFEDVSFGVISHGTSFNYTQVTYSVFLDFLNFPIDILISFRTPIVNG